MTVYEDLGIMLAKLPQVVRVQTGQVTIGRETYPAARYVEHLQHSPGTRAYEEGKREYTREGIYCVGMLPSVKLRGNVAFRIHGGAEDSAEDNRDWYVGGYYGAVTGRKQAVAQPNEFNPHGNSFLLFPWDLPSGCIDDHERVPYRRVACTLGRNWKKINITRFTGV